MSTLIQVTGNPGTGKSFSLKKLIEKVPEQVFYIDTDKKGPSWTG